MRNFVLVNARDEKALRKCQKDCSLKQSVILPYYNEGYVCFSLNKEYSFDELTALFFDGNHDEVIGAISIIAERYPQELYQLICSQKAKFPSRKLRFIFEVVVPSYLPLYLPDDRLMDYEFAEGYSNDIWVAILEETREFLSD